MSKNWINEEQPFTAGLLLGTLLKAGINAVPSVDENGDYKNEITVTLDDDYAGYLPEGKRRFVRIAVLPVVPE